MHKLCKEQADVCQGEQLSVYSYLEQLVNPVKEALSIAIQYPEEDPIQIIVRILDFVSKKLHLFENIPN